MKHMLRRLINFKPRCLSDVSRRCIMGTRHRLLQTPAMFQADLHSINNIADSSTHIYEALMPNLICDSRLQNSPAGSTLSLTLKLPQLVDRCEDLLLTTLGHSCHSVWLTYGADEDRTLDIPGEHLDNVISARQLVGWYNCVPRDASFTPYLDTDTAVVLGQGNVALDVARMLLTPVDRLRSTAWSQHVLPDNTGKLQLVPVAFKMDAAELGSASAATTTERKAPSGHPVPIVRVNKESMFELDTNALSEILLHPEVCDRHVVVVSVTGAFRKGKSFLLDFFLRYMRDPGNKAWMGTQDEPLTGFSWRGGSERETTGILVWSEVFLVDLPTGEKLAVILMDTQGAFDSDSSVRDCATIFALSTMLSSVQIYNLMHNIQEDDLQHLQLFADYGKLALGQTGEKPFQKLEFLIRDWSYPYEAPYGPVGGEAILNKRLAVSDNQHPDLKDLRAHIRSCFATISCFLLPHPGLRVATDPEFDGKLADIESEFKQHLQDLVLLVLAPHNLVVKEINGEKVKAKELLEYFKSYVELFKTADLPEPKSVLVATAEANNVLAWIAAWDTYHQLMKDTCSVMKPYIDPNQLETLHGINKDKAVNQFKKKRKMGGEKISAKYLAQLEKDLKEEYEEWKLSNESKLTIVYKLWYSLTALIKIIVLSFLLSYVCKLVGSLCPPAIIVSFISFIIFLITMTRAMWLGSAQMKKYCNMQSAIWPASRMLELFSIRL